MEEARIAKNLLLGNNCNNCRYYLNYMASCNFKVYQEVHSNSTHTHFEVMKIRKSNICERWEKKHDT